MASFSVALDICPAVCTRTPGSGGKGGKATLYHDQHTSLSDYMSCYLISVLPRPVMVAKEGRRLKSSTSFFAALIPAAAVRKRRMVEIPFAIVFPVSFLQFPGVSEAGEGGGFLSPGSNKNCTLGNSGEKTHPLQLERQGPTGRGIGMGNGVRF